VRCTQSDFLLHVKRRMLQFELTHKCANVLDYNNSSSSQNGLCVPGGRVYVNFRVSDVTKP